MQPPKFIDSRCPSRSPSTRRTFLGDSLGTTVGIASTLGIASTNGLASLPTVGAFVSGSDHLRVGLIGCGGRGTGAAMQATAADRGVQIVAMGDLFADQLASSARLLARDLGAQFACPPERQFIGDQAYKMVLDAGVDAVLLTTPPQARPLHLATAVGQGKHVFCEMPVAVDIAGVHQVAAACALARATKVSIVSGLCFRSDAPTVELMRRIHAGSIGHPLAVRVGAAIGLPWRRLNPRGTVVNGGSETGSRLLNSLEEISSNTMFMPSTRLFGPSAMPVRCRWLDRVCPTSQTHGRSVIVSMVWRCDTCLPMEALPTLAASVRSDLARELRKRCLDRRAYAISGNLLAATGSRGQSPRRTDTKPVSSGHECFCAGRAIECTGSRWRPHVPQHVSGHHGTPSRRKRPPSHVGRNSLQTENGSRG